MSKLIRAGAGLKPEHYRHILSARPDIGWFEVHAENFMGAGGLPHIMLERIRSSYPLSVHGVGLSIGSAAGMTPGHLARLKTVVDRYKPFVVSEHLAWSSHAGAYLNDLLPLPYDDETLALVARHVDEAQTVLGRTLLIENPSTYLRFDGDTLAETDFLRALAQRTGCGLLLDLNNVFVSAANHGFDASAYIGAFDLESVGEIHLAGHVASTDVEGLLIDTHDRPVCREVWSLYSKLMNRIGPIATLIEWDAEIPAWAILAGEVANAEAVLQSAQVVHANAA